MLISGYVCFLTHILVIGLAELPNVSATDECVCDFTFSLGDYTLNSEPVVYSSGMPALPPGCLKLPDSKIRCQKGSILDDGVIGSGSLNLKEVIAWNGPVTISMSFTLNFQIIFAKWARITLFFYNEPSAGVGLPEVDRVAYTCAEQTCGSYPGNIIAILDNQDLNQDDSQYRSVSIIIDYDQGTIIGNHFDILQFRVFFPDSTLLHWVLLSEIQHCTIDSRDHRPTCADVTAEIKFVDEESEITLGPDPVMSSVNLSCAVINEGLFDWEWRWNDAIFLPANMWLSDYTRNCTCHITDLSVDKAGKYICQASSVLGKRSHSISLTLKGAIKPFSAEEVNATIGSSIKLDCEVYGYTRSGSVVVNWFFYDTKIHNNFIREKHGNHEIQNGSSTPQPSIVSCLSLSDLKDDQFGVYTCSYNEMDAVVTLRFKPDPITSSSTTSYTPGSSTTPIMSLSTIPPTSVVTKWNTLIPTTTNTAPNTTSLTSGVTKRNTLIPATTKITGKSSSIMATTGARVSTTERVLTMSSVTHTPQPHSHKANTVAMVTGAVFGGLFLIVLFVVVIIVCFVYLKKKKAGIDLMPIVDDNDFDGNTESVLE